MDIEKAQHAEREIHVLARRTLGRRPILSVLVGAFLFFLSFNALVMRRRPISPSASSGLPLLTLGFALTPTYGTVAARDSDGHLVATGKVEGDEQYIQMMRKLSDPQSQHLSPPYGNLGEVIADWPRQALRQARIKLGLASTSDVGRLAALLQQLLRSIEADLPAGTQYSGAVLAFPNTIALYEEDACDTLTYLGIRDLVGTHVAESHPRAINVAFVGFGLRACNDWRDPEACKRDFRSLPFRRTLLVDYSHGALSLVVDRLASGASTSTRVVVDFEAGSDSRADDDEHWHQLRQQIHTIVDGSLWKSIDVVLLTGESAGEEAFQNAVREATQKYGAPRIYSSDPQFIAVKAASEMAWQAAEIQSLYPGRKYFPCPPT